MPQIWNPNDVLQLDNNGCCVGYAPTKGRGCTRKIRQGNVAEFKSILRQISRRQPDADQLESHLECLAKCGLCVKDHQNQIDDMVEQWSQRLRAEYPIENDERLQRSLAAASRVPTVSRVSTSDISSLHLSRSSTVVSSAASSIQWTPVVSESPASRITESVRTPPVAASPVSSPPVTPAPTVPQSTTPPRTCDRTHARRRSFDEECSICHEGESLSSLDASELIWCRSECGRTVHKSCFEDWRTQCEIDHRHLTCPICRTSWADEAECECEREPESTEPCPTQHVRRRAIEDDCPICRDEFIDEDGQRLQMHQLAWCKAGCGTNVHVDCFNEWKARCEDGERPATCVMCRAEWTDECEC